MPDQNYAELYEDMVESSQRMREAAGRAENIMFGSATAPDVVVPDYPAQPTWNKRFAAVELAMRQAIIGLGFDVGDPIRTFEAGAVLTSPNDVIRQTVGVNQFYWRWDGDFNKTVAPGSSPTPTGVGAWILAGDGVLGAALANGTAQLGPTTVGALTSGAYNFPRLRIGSGVKGNPQTNVGLQIHRDIETADFSYHGVNVCDYFAVNGIAFNPIGTDIQIGDGTQDASVVLNHVNDVQVTDETDLGLGRNAQHYCFASQPVLKSGTISRTSHFLAVDQLGVRDTPGFGVAGFEDNGPAVQNNQTGVVTVIRHGTNAKSVHVQAGSTDAGVLRTSGGAPVDIEAPVTIRQSTASTTRGTGALVLTAGGIGCVGAIHAGASVNAYSDAGPQFALRNEAGTLQGRLSHDGTSMRVVADTGSQLRFRVSAVDVYEVLSDRFRPVADNAYSIGDATHRPTNIFAVSDTINTSDEREKTGIQPIDDLILDAWAEVGSVSFQWISAVQEKGEDIARRHYGWIAQRVAEALEAKGIDGFKYGLLCRDKIMQPIEKTRPVRRVKTVNVEKLVDDIVLNDSGDPVLIKKPLMSEEIVYEDKIIVGEDGEPVLFDHFDYVYEDVPVKKRRLMGLLPDKVIGSKKVRRQVPVKKQKLAQVPVYETVDEPYIEEEFTGEYRMGLRYIQCLVVETAYLRRELAKKQG